MSTKYRIPPRQEPYSGSTRSTYAVYSPAMYHTSGGVYRGIKCLDPHNDDLDLFSIDRVIALVWVDITTINNLITCV